MEDPGSVDFDALWDYGQPGRSEEVFREHLERIPESHTARLELLTQIARAQGLQRKFDQAHQTLDQVEARLGEEPSRLRVRYLLERGRVFNSSGRAPDAVPLFSQAAELARQIGEDFYAVDAVHMLAITAPPDESLALNLQAIELAEASDQERARGWLASLYNNTGWAYHDQGNYEQALDLFERALESRKAKGDREQTLIAAWCVARTLRSLNRLEEALARQLDLEQEWERAGQSDGYVFEEIGECLLGLGRPEEARPYLTKAYERLGQDPWLSEQESGRLERLKVLGSGADDHKDPEA